MGVFSFIRCLPSLCSYLTYDTLQYIRYKEKKSFRGWGIHLFTGAFGSGKTSTMVTMAYRLCRKYPQLSIVTNVSLAGFPDGTRILPLASVQDILMAPPDTLVLIDEIGTIFNSRDFNSKSDRVPKELFQHLCQCRKRRMMIYGTVQRFCLLDKQLRDIAATVSTCHSYFRYPFSRLVNVRTYDIDDYEIWQSNRLYVPRPVDTTMYVQTERYRRLYDTTALVTNMLKSDYKSDVDILQGRGDISVGAVPITRQQQRRIRRGL